MERQRRTSNDVSSRDPAKRAPSEWAPPAARASRVSTNWISLIDLLVCSRLEMASSWRQRAIRRSPDGRIHKVLAHGLNLGRGGDRKHFPLLREGGGNFLYRKRVMPKGTFLVQCCF